MPQAFSIFPDGWPGAGLLILRVAIGATLIPQGICYFDYRHGTAFSAVIVSALIIAVGCFVVLGFWTRILAGVAAMIDIVSLLPWFPGLSSGPLGMPFTSTLAVAIAVAVLCLGAGALSIDARIFGRREIIIPPAAAKERESGPG